MVSTFQMQAFYRPNSLTVDTHSAQKFFEEEDSGIMDDSISILDHSAVDSGLEMSPPMAASRRDSFAVAGSLFSPKTEDWQSSVDMQSLPSNNPFLESHSNNPFTRPDQSQPAYTTQSQQPWSMGAGSGTCTPLPYDGLEATYDSGAASMFQRAMPIQTPFSNPTGQVPLFSTVGSNNSATSVPASPQQRDWMGPADFKSAPAAKRMRPGSPSAMIRSHNELRRGDGIRKKNARFDIPAERNLSNIDQLISQSTDEQEIKELKQQKRLLRNRQAALDSRQRKKMHTERLEDEKKQYTSLLNSMEEEIADVNLKLAQLMREKDFLQDHIDSLRMEKEEMVQSHTIETGDLRKKVAILTDHVQRLENAATMSGGSAGGFAATNGFGNEMDGLAAAPWDDSSMGFMADYAIEAAGPHEVKQEAQQQQQQQQLVPAAAAKKPEVAFPADLGSSGSEKPSAAHGGLLFLAFLVGTFVLSKGSTTPTLPRVSEDVREASATILDDIFKDAGVAHNAPDDSSSSSSAMAHAAAAAPPQPSGVVGGWAPMPSPMAGMSGMGMGMGMGMDGVVAPSMLGDLADSLTQPTEDQLNQQLFSLTPAQYNGVQSQDFPMRHQHHHAQQQQQPRSQGRRNLADALAHMRSEKQQHSHSSSSSSSAADVYTRSLLWDQIPGDVVRNFAKMVAECNSNDGGGGEQQHQQQQQQQQPPDHPNPELMTT
ncbi:bZIP transcription factor [Xylariaceae sp. FL0804]|nr:bZIP transcription factor [Xylariaceae sp. FL0804]